MDLALFASGYNKSRARSFQRKNALKRYLDPIGLYTSPPTAEYANNSTPFNREEEQLYFKALHFAKWKLRQALKIEKNINFWLKMAITLRNRIVSANMGLIFASIKITGSILSHDSQENADILKSVGGQVLIRATDKFDPWRGYRFSTYGITAMLRSFSSQAKKYNRPPMGDVYDIDAPADQPNEHKDLMVDRALVALKKSHLTKQERDIITRRYFHNKRLKDVGKELGMCKERVRQIQRMAMKKVRATFGEDAFTHL